MSFDILHRWTKAVVYHSEDCSELGHAVVEAIAKSASLDRASLDGASLDGANLYGANLYGANLDGASLYRANLYGANLDGASLDRANLYGANLYGANLDGANLYGAKFTETTVMPNGETWKDYLGAVVPALLIAGGLTMESVCDPAHWNCHDWNNCPMAAAFHIKSENDAPVLLIPRVREFVQYFDAKLIPNPLTGELPK